MSTGGVPEGLFCDLRVVEFGHYVAAPLVGQLLADLGADVLKVEPPAGDPYRREPGRFVTWNRGKRSVVLDLCQQADHDRAIELVRSADVVVENFRPGVLARLGIDLDSLRAQCAGLVTCSISGFGSSGPLRDAPGWEPIVHGRAGLHVGFGELHERVWRPFPLASVTAGLLGTLGIVAALLERDRSGHGQHVETSLLDAALYMNGSAVLQGDAPPIYVQSRTDHARVHMYPTADGWLQVVAGTDRSDVAFDELVRTTAATLGSLDGSSTHSETGEPLTEQVMVARAVMATKTAVEWERILSDLGIPAGVAGPPEHWFAHPLAQAAEMSVEWKSSPFGSITTVGPPIRARRPDGTSVEPADAPPALGDASPRWCCPGRFTSRAPQPSAPTGAVLEGVRMLDLTRILPGPLTGRLLAELGAEVVKIEPPGGEEGYSVPFMYLEGNRSKSSTVIDLRTSEGRDQYRDLVSTADVVIENARAGVWEKFGLGEVQLREIRPTLVYPRSKGFGLDGPYAERRAFEHVLQAMSGMQMTQGGSQPPRMMTIPAADYSTGTTLAIGVVCGLIAGRRGGTWPTVNASLAMTSTLFEAEHLTEVEGHHWVRDDVGPDLHGPDAARQIYHVDDGWVVVFAIDDRQRSALVDVLGVATLDTAAIADSLAARSVADVVDLLTAAGVPAGPSVQPQAAADDEQVVARQLLVELQSPVYGSAIQVGVPFSLSRTPPQVVHVSPVLKDN